MFEFFKLNIAATIHMWDADMSTLQVQSTSVPTSSQMQYMNKESNITEQIRTDLQKDVVNTESKIQITNVKRTSSSYTQSLDIDIDPADDGNKVLSFGESPDFPLENEQNKALSKRNVGVQVQQKLTKPHFRSKSVMCVSSMSNKYCQSTVEMVDSMCSPIKSFKRTIESCSRTSTSADLWTSDSINTASDFQPSSHSEYNYSSNCSEEEKNKKMKESALNLTRYFISMDAKKYIGIDKEWLWIIDMFHSFTKCCVDDIKLTLMKIRTNDSFSRLGDQFGLSTSQASRIFNKTVKPLADCLKNLIFCPDPKHIKLNLSIPFRAYYSNVCAIIDAFEIEIEKPSDPIQQSLTWSEYKKCNTLKYLIASAPDGFIIFISSGYGGRISDTLLFEESNMMDILPKKCGVMADRGFKQIQTVLSQKGCELIRPPSVNSSTKSTKQEVLTTKRIASLRIHIERVIRRVREYKILKPHSCLDLHVMPHIDSITTIVAGLINLQKPIIKNIYV